MPFSTRLPGAALSVQRRPEGWALCAFLVGFCAYRAATQSITYDEACTYLQFVRGSWWDALTQYNANNHVLFTLLAKLSTDTLGVTELTLRLPTLLGAILYATSALMLCHRLAVDRVLAALACAAVTLNPFVLDFLVAARGYGLALGLLLAALVMLTRALEPSNGARNAWWMAGASVALGLSVSANLAFAFPAAGVICAATALGSMPVRSRARDAVWLVVPGALAASTVLAVPLSHARSEHFFYGATSLGSGLTSLIAASIRYHDAALPGADGTTGAGVVTVAASAGVSAAALWLGLWLGRRLRTMRHPDPAGPATALVGVVVGATLLTPLLAVAAHWVSGLPYPHERTAIYLIPLCTLALVGTLYGRDRAPVLLAVLSVLVAVYVAQLDWTHFRTWRFDASSRQLFVLARTARQHAHCPGRLAASWLLEPSLRFYATILPQACPMDVVHAWQPGTRGYDVYVLTPEDDAAMTTVVDVIHVDRLSGAAVAVEQPPELHLARTRASRSPLSHGMQRAPVPRSHHGDDAT